MTLIEPRILTKYQESKTISKLGGEMRKILHRDIEDAAKAKLYSDILSKYLKLDKPTIKTKVTAKDVEKTTVYDITVKESDSGPRKRKSLASRDLTGMKNDTDIADIIDVGSMLKRISA